ncbi:ABC transporter substrate-binding protein [Salininema proteolyticum]|uniref:ABC transporter substrate-binding protein n=1 Tax=Salininema proteolyticum TaxID=1607685 RepID=A0ABV8TUV9_9ACTN
MPIDFHPTMSTSRRRLLGTAVAIGAATALAACGEETSEGGSQGASQWAYTDGRDRKVELPGAPESIVAFTGLAAALHDYGIGVDAVFGPTVKADGSPDLQAGRLDVDGLTIIGNALGEFDEEAYVGLEPDVLISHFYAGFDLWFVPEEHLKTVESNAPTIGIEVSGGDLTEIIARHTDLAKALGADLDGDEAKDAQARYNSAAETLSAAKKPPKVLACTAIKDYFYVGDHTWFPDLQTAAALGVEFVEPETDETGYWETLSWENVGKYEADVILLDVRTQSLQQDAMAEFPTWKVLPAVQAGKVFSWNPEPVYSPLGGAEALELIAEAVKSA